MANAIRESIGGKAMIPTVPVITLLIQIDPMPYSTQKMMEVSQPISDRFQYEIIINQIRQGVIKLKDGLRWIENSQVPARDAVTKS